MTNEGEYCEGIKRCGVSRSVLSQLGPMYGHDMSYLLEDGECKVYRSDFSETRPKTCDPFLNPK